MVLARDTSETGRSAEANGETRDRYRCPVLLYIGDVPSLASCGYSAHASISQSMSEKRTRRKAIVVGCGVGGSTTAARLACAGFDVEVFEKVGLARIGSPCSTGELIGWKERLFGWKV